MKRLILSVASAALMLSVGCTTLYTESQRQTEQAAADVQNLRDEVSRLKERVTAMDAVQQDLYRQIQEARAASPAENRQIRDRLAELEHQVGALDAARASDREQIVKDLSSRVSDVVRSQPAASRPAKAERGYEHVVKSGQTLSAIATAYKVSPKAIMEANNIKNANTIRIGQKLFIPAE